MEIDEGMVELFRSEFRWEILNKIKSKMNKELTIYQVEQIEECLDEVINEKKNALNY